METYRLKNIILVILLLLNVFLLLLVASRGYAQHRSAQNLIDQTVLFLQNSNVSIDPELLQGQDTAFTYSYERNMEEEQAFTAALLGTLVKQQDAGGGTQQHTFTGGSAVFRSNGAFQLTIAAPELQVEKPEVFVKKYCPAQYAFTAAETVGERTVITATPYVDNLPVYSAAMEFVLQDGLLCSASGFFIPASGSTIGDAQAIGKCSSVIYLIDYCNEAGRICNTISEISSGYVLQSTASVPLLLSPVYCIDTNTYRYYVDAVTGHVSVAK